MDNIEILKDEDDNINIAYDKKNKSYVAYDFGLRIIGVGICVDSAKDAFIKEVIFHGGVVKNKKKYEKKILY